MSNKTNESIIKELYEHGLDVNQIHEKTGFKKDVVYETTRVLERGFDSNADYMQFLAETNGFKSYYEYLQNLKQNRFEDGMEILPIKNFKNITVGEDYRLVEDVNMFLDRLETYSPGGKRLRGIIEKRYFENKKLMEIGIEEKCHYKRISELERIALKRLSDIAKEYYEKEK